MAIELWDFENDVIAKRDYSSTHWAYSLNTDAGQYRMKITNEQISENVGNGLTVSYSNENRKLMLDTECETICVMEHITVWPTSFNDLFLIFHSEATGQVFLIDGRGVLFELPYIRKSHSVWDYGKVEIDKRLGVFVVDNQVKIRYRSAEEQQAFVAKSQPNSGAVFNKEFNKFIRNNARNTNAYLYLTIGNNKCGVLARYFIEQGLEYEVVPNILCDDDTLNIRITIDNQSLTTPGVQLLYSKYQNTYSVYGVPISVIGGALVLPQKNKDLWHRLGFYMPKGKESICYSILETLRSSCKATDDYDLYKKSFAKVVRLFERCMSPDICVLQKDEVMKLESHILAKLADAGVKIGRWTSEADLFAVVKKIYPDAIYQYHVDWLGLQSLDIFIPSLNVAIEYQGEQHFKPVAFFGGDVAFRSVLERDKRKATLCKKNNVNLIYWMYDEVISTAQLKAKLHRVLNN